MSERDKRQWQLIKSDPVRYAAYLERKRRERRGKKEYETQRKRNWRIVNAERAQEIRQANHAVERAVESGRLVRPTNCSRCGVFGKIEAHHASYAPEHWLHVEWLCINCHAAEHHPTVLAGDAS